MQTRKTPKQSLILDFIQSNGPSETSEILNALSHNTLLRNEMIMSGLHYMVRTGKLIRTGTRKHFTYAIAGTLSVQDLTDQSECQTI